MIYYKCAREFNKKERKKLPEFNFRRIYKKTIDIKKLHLELLTNQICN